MDIKEDLFAICSYFYEVLIKKYLELERNFAKKSGLLSLFKKINFEERAKAFDELRTRAIEAREELLSKEFSKSDCEMYSLSLKLAECIAIYINMVQTQIEINNNLNLKANGEKYNWSEYSKSLEFFDMLRDSLEGELPKLQSLFSTFVKLKGTDVLSVSE